MATHLDLEEQEQLDQLKHFWRQWGNFITWTLVIVLGAFAAYNGWNMYQRSQAAKASVLFDELDKAAQAGDADKAARVFSDMKEHYGRTAFAEQAPGFDAASGPVAIVGAGGAARGAVGALLDAGCTDIRIINRTIGRAEALASELGGHAFELQDAEAAFGDVSAVINATSAGLDGAGALHVPLSLDVRGDLKLTAMWPGGCLRQAEHVCVSERSHHSSSSSSSSSPAFSLGPFRLGTVRARVRSWSSPRWKYPPSPVGSIPMMRQSPFQESVFLS